MILDVGTWLFKNPRFRRWWRSLTEEDKQRYLEDRKKEELEYARRRYEKQKKQREQKQ
jgi:hypothetical protein